MVESLARGGGGVVDDAKGEVGEGRDGGWAEGGLWWWGIALG